MELGNLLDSFSFNSIWSSASDTKKETGEMARSSNGNGDIHTENFNSRDSGTAEYLVQSQNGKRSSQDPSVETAALHSMTMQSAVTGFGAPGDNGRGSVNYSAEDGHEASSSRGSGAGDFGKRLSSKIEMSRTESLNSQLAALESYKEPDEDDWEEKQGNAKSKMMATKQDMQRVKELRAKHDKLKQLRDKYQIRVADAQKRQQEAKHKVRKVPPAILRKGQLWTCEGVVDEAVEIDMADRKRSQEGELRISKCYTTGTFWSRTASVRVVGRARSAIIEDCHKLLLTVDGIEKDLVIRRCSNLTIALASEMPAINMMRVKDSDLVLCYNANSARTVQTCMCTGITLHLLEADSALFHSVDVLNQKQHARKVQIPDVVDVQCMGQTLQCTCQTSRPIDQSTLTLSLDCIEDFQPIRNRLDDKDSDQVERNLCQPSEQTQARQVVDMGGVGTMRHISAAFLQQDPFFHTRKHLLYNV